MSAAGVSDAAEDPSEIIRGGLLSDFGSDDMENNMLEHLLDVLGEEEFRRALQAGTLENEDVDMEDVSESTILSSEIASEGAQELYTEKVFRSACHSQY